MERFRPQNGAAVHFRDLFDVRSLRLTAGSSQKAFVNGSPSLPIQGRFGRYHGIARVRLLYLSFKVFARRKMACEHRRMMVTCWMDLGSSDSTFV